MRGGSLPGAVFLGWVLLVLLQLQSAVCPTLFLLQCATLFLLFAESIAFFLLATQSGFFEGPEKPTWFLSPHTCP